MRGNKINLTIILMILISLTTQALSLLKTSIVAGAFGIESDMDAFNLANSIAMFIFDFIAVGISTIIIPEYANKRNKKSVDTFITIIYSVILVVIMLIIVMRDQILGLLSNRDESFITITGHILVILLFTKYLQSIANITVAYFQCEGKYIIPKIITLVCNVGVIVILIVIKNIDIIQYTIIFASGLVLNFLIDLFVVKRFGWKYRPTVSFDEKSNQLFMQFLPLVISTGVYRLSLITDTIISSFLDVGKLSILNYSVQIASMVDALIVGNLVTYLYPKITKKMSEEGYQKKFWKDTAVLHAIVCLLCAGFMTVGHEGLELLFQRGSFSAHATDMVFIGAGIYLIGYQPKTIRALLSRYFYGSGDTRVPSITSVIENISNIIISVLLVKLIGFYGIIIGTFASSMIALGLTLRGFKKRFGFEEKFTTIIQRYFISIVIFLFTVVLVYATKHFFAISNNLISIIIFGIETVIIYVVFSGLFNKETFVNFKNL